MGKIKIDEIKNVDPKRTHGDIKSLKESIQEVGLINPLTINQDYKLLAGRRRYQAIRELGWEEVDARIINSENELFDFKVAIEENLRRKPLTDIETATVIKEYDEMKRELEGSQPQGKHRSSSSLPFCGNDGWSHDKTAKDLNISRQAVNKAIHIAKAVEEYPELAKSRKGTVILREYKVKKDEKRIGKEAPLKQIQSKFRTILIDPPWDYEGLSLAGRGIPKYKVMGIEELEKLNIQKYADKECHA